MPSGLDRLLTGIQAAADSSRLRLLAVCSEGEWTVSELVQVLGQSQPRVSRHLKILAEAGLLDRFREGSWVFHRRARGGEGAKVAGALCRLLPEGDPALALDRHRLEAVREGRRRAAERYFADRAEGWDSERDLGIDGGRVEEALRRIFEPEPAPSSLLDVGTGTGRVLQVLADRIGFGLGIDASHEMLAVARANLDHHRAARHCQVRHGDMYRLPLPDGSFDAVTLHQVLHFADDPPRVLAEAARVLAPGGRLVVADLASHGQEALRAERAHRRLGFGEAEMSGWLAEQDLVEERPLLLPGPELTVVIWNARRRPAAGEAAAGAFEDSGRRDAA